MAGIIFTTFMIIVNLKLRLGLPTLKGPPVYYILSIILSACNGAAVILLLIGILIIFKKIIRWRYPIYYSYLLKSQRRFETPRVHGSLDAHIYEEIPEQDVIVPFLYSQALHVTLESAPTEQSQNIYTVPSEDDDDNGGYGDDNDYDYISPVNFLHAAGVSQTSELNGDYINPIYNSLNTESMFVRHSDDRNDERSSECDKRSCLDSNTNVKRFFSSDDVDNENSGNETALKEVVEVYSNTFGNETALKEVVEVYSNTFGNETALKEVVEVDSNTFGSETDLKEVVEMDSNTFPKELYDSNTDSVQIDEETDSLSSDSEDLTFLQHQQQAVPNTYSKLK